MIKVLDSFGADKIAAGEVIERPVSAVKELVENSIDAGATSVIIEIRNGGRSYIRVTDNGCGIPEAEAETAFLRHATSKISGIEDLDSIKTLGFRGEALTSIAAVSRFTMVSRTRDSNTGTRLVLHGGSRVLVERTGANPGTSMIVEDLFYNTPARRKFMKSDAREASAVTELAQQLAVCRPDIRFMMISDGRTVFSTQGDGDTLAVINALYPGIGKSGLIPVNGNSVKGYVSGPSDTRSNRRGQLFFVNGRLVSSGIIEKAVEEGYHGRIFSGYPAAILFIEADPSEIDINIHPGKREIRFLRQDEVIKNISEAVAAAVMSDQGIPGATGINASSVGEYPDEEESLEADYAKSAELHAAEQSSIKEYLQGLKTVKSGEYPAPAADRHLYGSNEGYENSESYEERESREAGESGGEDLRGATDAGRPAPFDFDGLELRGYIFDTYIIMQDSEDIYIFDQHAAHERVFYEKLMSEYSSDTHSPQPVLTPFTFGVSADVTCMGGEWLDELRQIGYDIEEFGERTFMVRGIPSYMDLREADSFLRSYAEEAAGTRAPGAPVRDKLIMKACKAAAKASERLSEMEIRELIIKLSECDNPFACPHGRPTFIRISKSDIEKSFKRK